MRLDKLIGFALTLIGVLYIVIAILYWRDTWN